MHALLSTEENMVASPFPPCMESFTRAPSSNPTQSWKSASGARSPLKLYVFGSTIIISFKKSSNKKKIQFHSFILLLGPAGYEFGAGRLVACQASRGSCRYIGVGINGFGPESPHVCAHPTLTCAAALRYAPTLKPLDQPPLMDDHG